MPRIGVKEENRTARVMFRSGEFVHEHDVQDSSYRFLPPTTNRSTEHHSDAILYDVSRLRITTINMKSSSNLTRAVFRAIVANRPYVVAECRRHVHRSNPLYMPQPSLRQPQRRALFTAILSSTMNRGFKGAKPTAKNLELALGKLVDLVRARRTRSRAPSDEELIDAFKFVFGARLEVQRRLTRNEIYLTTEAFKHFQESGLLRDDLDKPSLTKADLDMVLSALAIPSEKEKFRTDTKALASLVFNALPTVGTQVGTETQIQEGSQSILPIYIQVLAKTGSAMEALDLLRTSQNAGMKHNVRAWIAILKGLANEGRLKELETALESAVTELHSQGHDLDVAEYEEMVSFLANDSKIEEVKRVYDVFEHHGLKPTTSGLQILTELCARTQDNEWGQAHANALRGKIDEEGVVGTLFIWYAVQSRSLGELKQRMEDLLHDVSMGDISMDSFNHLFKYGLQQNRPEFGTAALDVAEALDLRPNGKTYALQLKHEINKGDMIAASDAFEHMIREDIPSDDFDLSVLNKYAAVLAFSPELDYPLLMRVVDILLERNADFDAETLAGLCRVFLQRDELEDAAGLLRHRADFYPAEDRSRIAAVFREFIMDKSLGDQRVFNVYELFRHAFPETPPEERLPIMQSFFDRKRPDLACLVFGHMRQREDIECRPTPTAYAQCFAGIAQCRDVDGLQMVFNMLKLDLEVEPTTRIRNGLMLAYISCQMPYTAMIDHFWKIIDSREGPTYSTFEIGLRACETWVPRGGFEARKIIAIMQAWNLEITKELYDCYVGAVAGQSEFENAVELIEEMENDIGERPDALTLGAFYNAIPWQYRKDEVEKWAKQAYPDIWADVESYGDEIDEEWEIRYFKIDRTIDIEDEPLFASGSYDPQLSRKAVASLEPLTVET